MQLAAAEAPRAKYPLEYAQRFTAAGAQICRYHNYSVCLRRGQAANPGAQAQLGSGPDPKACNRSSASELSGNVSMALRRADGGRCECDHEHCHACGQRGHRAVECPRAAAVPWPPPRAAV